MENNSKIGTIEERTVTYKVQIGEDVHVAPVWVEEEMQKLGFNQLVVVREDRKAELPEGVKAREFKEYSPTFYSSDFKKDESGMQAQVFNSQAVVPSSSFWILLDEGGKTQLDDGKFYDLQAGIDRLKEIYAKEDNITEKSKTTGKENNSKHQE